MKNKCLDCEHLSKEKKMEYGKAYLYGCNLRETGYVSTWINTDDTLGQISCNVIEVSDEDEEGEEEPVYGQMDIFNLLE